MKLFTHTLFFFLLVTQISFAQWEWQYPLPQGNTLNDVFFTDAYNGTAVGDIGTIIRTTNGGIDWIVQDSGTELNLTGVNFINNDIGYVVGANRMYYSNEGRILRTTNGGATWTSQLIDSVQLNDIYFTDSNNGMAVGNNGKIWKTTDGGIIWNEQNIPATNTNLNAVSFIDNNIGCITGSDIVLKTEDGGISWIQQNIGVPHSGTSLRDVCFTDVNNIWVCGYDPWTDWKGIIFKTTDGGTTWSYQFHPETQGLNSICFANQDLGWTVGSDFYNSTILKTTNAGDTWEQQSSNNGSQLNAIFILNVNEAWIVGKGGTIRKTTDSGANWININGEQADLKDVIFLDLMNGWAVGGGGTVLKTTNGGFSWNLQSTAGTLTLRAVYFCDENNGWAVSDGNYYDTSKVFHTTDSGTTWNSQINIPSSSLSDIFFLDANTGFAGGGNGGSIFLSTTNGGLTWNAVYDTLVSIRRIQFINENIGYILSTIEGWYSPFLIYKTEDGGETWNIKLETGDWPGLYDMYFWDADNGIAVGRAVFRTTDGGETWTDTLTLSSVYSPEIYVYMNQVTAVGSGGQIYQSTDFGVTWNSQTSGTEKYLEGVFFINALNGWAVGDNGTIIHTTNGGVSFVQEEQIIELPTKFLLSQNYPNPFNPSTKIKYSVPQVSQVQIKVFDVLGNEIETLVNEEKPVGTYEITWYAEGLPSGVYFYQIKAGSFVETKKMVLMK